MTVLPSPIPHPLDYFPFVMPGWADKVLESVIGIGWPAGDEAGTWDVADRWYAAAGELAGSHAEAAQIMAGNDDFRDAWARLAGDPAAPLNALVEIAGEVGALVEDCGRSIEAAKLDAWIEIGLFLTELNGMAIVGPLTLGAASPAADGMIAATRYALAQIFSRLASELGAVDHEALPDAGGTDCVDAVLALYDTRLHAHPGAPAGPQRIEEAIGAAFQNLCPYLGAATPADAKPAVDAAMRNLANHLHNSGHGAFAVIVTDLEGGGWHCWAALNQDGAILFLDPQTGRSSEETPLYYHRGAPSPANVIAMDALVVDGRGQPAPLPYHGPGRWTAGPG